MRRRCGKQTVTQQLSSNGGGLWNLHSYSRRPPLAHSSSLKWIKKASESKCNQSEPWLEAVNSTTNIPAIVPIWPSAAVRWAIMMRANLSTWYIKFLSILWIPPLLIYSSSSSIIPSDVELPSMAASSSSKHWLYTTLSLDPSPTWTYLVYIVEPITEILLGHWWHVLFNFSPLFKLFGRFQYLPRVLRIRSLAQTDGNQSTRDRLEGFGKE